MSKYGCSSSTISSLMVSLGNCCGDEERSGGGEGGKDLERTKPRFMSVNTHWEQTLSLKEPLHAYRRWRRYNWMTEKIVSVSEEKKPLVKEEHSLESRCGCFSRKTGGNRDVRPGRVTRECKLIGRVQRKKRPKDLHSCCTDAKRAVGLRHSETDVF